MYEKLINKLSGILPVEDLKTDELMKDHTSFKVGGPARVFLKIRSENSLAEVLKIIKEENIPFFVLGNGSNLLVADGGYEGVIIYLEEEFSDIRVNGNVIEAGAAALLSMVSTVAMEHSLKGLEFASGIPGSMGGGAVMNAGAYGGELSDSIIEIIAMDEEGNIQHLDNEMLEFGYRKSIFKRKTYIILKVFLLLERGDKEVIKECMNRYNASRREKQPLEYPSAGSTFKRPEGNFAGKLIMDAGLRGYSVGGAQVSEKHCGFIINKEKATADDILTLMEKVREKVKANSGIELEPEVICLGK